MLTKELIVASLQKATYEHKEGTKLAYGWKSGATIFPKSMRINLEGFFADAKHTGRMASQYNPPKGDLKGNFTKDEVSPLKQEPVKRQCKYKLKNGETKIRLADSYEVSTKLFQSADFPQFLYGDLAVSNAETNATDKKEGLVVVWKVSDSVLELYYMAGVTENPSDLQSVFQVVSDLIKE